MTVNTMAVITMEYSGMIFNRKTVSKKTFSRTTFSRIAVSIIAFTRMAWRTAFSIMSFNRINTTIFIRMAVKRMTVISLKYIRMIFSMPVSKKTFSIRKCNREIFRRLTFRRMKFRRIMLNSQQNNIQLNA